MVRSQGDVGSLKCGYVFMGNLTIEGVGSMKCGYVFIGNLSVEGVGRMVGVMCSLET